MLNERKNEQGFTLMELLIVMVILGLLAALVGPPIRNHLITAKQGSAKSQIAMLEGAIETYMTYVGNYPKMDEGLQALREKPAGAKKWKGPYLKKALPNDPWGNSYVYIYPGQHGTDYDIISYGADGAPGGEGENMDIVSWKELEG